MAHPAAKSPACIDADGRIRDLSKIVPDIAGDVLSPAASTSCASSSRKSCRSCAAIRASAPCVGKVGNFIAIGLNYSDHAAEAGMPIPKEPIIFNKAPSCICGPNDDTMIPKDSTKLDWEVELGIVIGSPARYLSKEKALDVVAGYCLANDVSERVFQIERAGQWTKGKGCETFGPLGPWLVTKDEIKDPQKLDMWLDVNGEKRQRGNTSTMIFDCRHIVWACSQYFALEPGDVIITGTPPGVGLGMKPEPKFLKAGRRRHARHRGPGRAAAEGREVQDVGGGCGRFRTVMAGLVPAIHVFGRVNKTWMPATSAGMTLQLERSKDFIRHLENRARRRAANAPARVRLRRVSLVISDTFAQTLDRKPHVLRRIENEILFSPLPGRRRANALSESAGRQPLEFELHTPLTPTIFPPGEGV